MCMMCGVMFNITCIDVLGQGVECLPLRIKIVEAFFIEMIKWFKWIQKSE